MKTIFFSLIILSLSCQSVLAQYFYEEPLSTLRWLESKWERIIDNPNQTGYEKRDRMNHVLQGLGGTIQEGDTVFVEKLSIEMMDGDWYYVADMTPNVEPTYFKITGISDAGFVSHNPGHDFPKKIVYQLSGDGEFRVIIPGDNRSVPFIF